MMKGTPSKLAQKELHLLALIHGNHNASRIELAKMTGTSIASMTAIVQRLIRRGLVIESGKGSGALGRKPVSLSLRNELGYVIGVDLGSFLTRVVVTDVSSKTLYKAEMPTKMAEGRDAVIRRTFDAVHQAMKQAGISRDTLKGIGMAHSGVIDTQNDTVLCFRLPVQMTQWRNVAVRVMLEKELGVPSA